MQLAIIKLYNLENINKRPGFEDLDTALINAQQGKRHLMQGCSPSCEKNTSYCLKKFFAVF